MSCRGAGMGDFFLCITETLCTFGITKNEICVRMENSSLKIGLFNECFPPIQDGVAQVVENYARLLQVRGNDVTVATAKVPFFDYSQPYHVRNFLSIPVLVRMPYRLGLPVWMAPFQPIMKYKADIYHGHSPFTAGRIALKLSKKYNAPFVMTFHSKFRDDFRRSVPSDTVVDLMIKRIMSLYEYADEVWIPQPAVLDVMREYGYKGKVEVVPNAIDYDLSGIDISLLKQTSRKSLGIKSDEFCLLFVGQIIWEKNIAYILDAVNLLRDLPIKMFFVGKGYAESELKEKINRYGLNDKVVMTGQLQDRTALQVYYAAADIFLFPSLYDNSPLVLREAAAHNTPAVLFENTTSAEVINNGVNGFLSKQGDAAVYADYVKKILLDKKRLDTVGLKASQTLGLRWEQLMPEVEDRYRHLISRKQNG